MAISDKTFEAAELDDALTANPALKEHVLASIKKLGYTPYTTTEFDAAIGTKIGEKTSELYTGLDNDIFSASGIAKEGTEKTYDYAKRVIGGLKSAPTALQTEIADLKRTIANGSGDATMKAQLEALQTKEAETAQKLEDAGTKLFQKDVLLDVREGLRDLKYDPNVKESVRKVLVDSATAAIVGRAKVQKNADNTEQIVYVQEGKTMLTDKNVPADAAYILRDMLKDVLDAGHQGAGGGAGRDDKAPEVDASGNVKAPTARPADKKTRDAVRLWLLELGLKQGTAAFSEAYATHSKGLPAR
ncbi:hypothetical protein EAH73_11940 [Hymenobacter nivis]|uniref:Uncharacterized protein n=2 Tax=Hymenobacter nivis TaxID=1850093 RepID=A0A502GW11_9BACT|nr:hypothetical protein EAH73_11940 [Hymenobacter nivis]